MLEIVKKPAFAHNEFARQTWLNYYNDYLRDRGIISEEEWRKMRCAITASGQEKIERTLEFSSVLF